MKKKLKSYSKKEVLQQLASYCAYQDRCMQEITLKLKDYDLPQEEKDWVVDQLISEQFIDELRFARTYSRSKFYYKKWGKKKISYALKGKGISNSYIDEGLKEIKESDYFDTLETLLEKKKNSLKESEPFAVKKKLYAYAVSKGYEPSIVMSIIE
ncbi:MAG: hypothetical protein CMO01_27890 [Thalassobius sp.]|nr:hypothetical protein [Thalassovita sp.]